MNVLFLGNNLLAQRLTLVLRSDHDIKVAHLVYLPFALGLIKQNKFDMVIVDYLIDEVVDVCYQICGLARVPVVLMLREKEADWKKLYNIRVDGFLAEEASGSEILARVYSLSRRHTLVKQKA